MSTAPDNAPDPAPQDVPPVLAETAAPPRDDEERMWAMFCHLSSFAEYVFPFGHVVGPLVVYLLKKDEYASVADQGKESLNFQLSCTIYAAVLGISGLLLCLLLPLLLVIPLLQIVFTVRACLAANRGELYRYPLTIRFLT